MRIRSHISKRIVARTLDCDLCGARDVPCRAWDDDMDARLCLACEAHAEAAERGLLDAGIRQPDVVEAAQMRMGGLG